MYKLVILACLVAVSMAEPAPKAKPDLLAPVAYSAAYTAPVAAAYSAPLAYSAYPAYSPLAYSAYASPYASPYAYYLR